MTERVTASVGEPTPIPQRPTLYVIVYKDDRGYWAIDSMHGIKDYADMKHTTRPGSVLATIPGSTPPSSPAPASGAWAGPYKVGTNSNVYDSNGVCVVSWCSSKSEAEYLCDRMNFAYEAAFAAGRAAGQVKCKTCDGTGRAPYTSLPCLDCQNPPTQHPIVAGQGQGEVCKDSTCVHPGCNNTSDGPRPDGWLCPNHYRETIAQPPTPHPDLRAGPSVITKDAAREALLSSGDLADAIVLLAKYRTAIHHRMEIVADADGVTHREKAPDLRAVVENCIEAMETADRKLAIHDYNSTGSTRRMLDAALTLARNTLGGGK